MSALHRNSTACTLALLTTLLLVPQAHAQTYSYAQPQPFPFMFFPAVAPARRCASPPFRASQELDEAAAGRSAHLRRQVVSYTGREAPGTVIIDTPNTYLYYVLGDGQAIRYGIGVGRDGFTWSGTADDRTKAEWPDWYPPAEMIARQPYLPRFMAGGPGNPLGARAMYLGNSVYRIHGTNVPSTIGERVSSGCIRMVNEDVDGSLQPRQYRHQGRGVADERLSPGRDAAPAPIRQHVSMTSDAPRPMRPFRIRRGLRRPTARRMRLY